MQRVLQPSRSLLALACSDGSPPQREVRSLPQVITDFGPLGIGNRRRGRGALQIVQRLMRARCCPLVLPQFRGYICRHREQEKDSSALSAGNAGPILAQPHLRPKLHSRALRLRKPPLAGSSVGISRRMPGQAVFVWLRRVSAKDPESRFVPARLESHRKEKQLQRLVSNVQRCQSAGPPRPCIEAEGAVLVCHPTSQSKKERRPRRPSLEASKRRSEP